MAAVRGRNIAHRLIATHQVQDRYFSNRFWQSSRTASQPMRASVIEEGELERYARYTR